MTREEIKSYYNHGGILDLKQFQLYGYNVRIDYNCVNAQFYCNVTTRGRYPKTVYSTHAVSIGLIIYSLYHLEDSIKYYAAKPKTLKTLLQD